MKIKYSNINYYLSIYLIHLILAKEIDNTKLKKKLCDLKEIYHKILWQMNRLSKSNNMKSRAVGRVGGRRDYTHLKRFRKVFMKRWHSRKNLKIITIFVKLTLGEGLFASKYAITEYFWTGIVGIWQQKDVILYTQGLTNNS